MTSDVVSIQFKQGISLEHAEAAVRILGRPSRAPQSVALDFSQCQHIDAGAGFRIGNALRLYRDRCNIVATVPVTDTFQDHWHKAFTRSGLGLALAKYATTVKTAQREITKDLAEYYQNHIRPEWQNLVLVRDLHRGTALDVTHFTAFVRKLYDWLPYVNIRHGSLKREAAQSLAQLCYEAVQNVVDHAARSPLPEGTSIMSYFSMRYYKELSAPKAFPGPIATYLDRITQSRTTTEYTPFVEVVVNDDGVGISARQAQSEDIYRGELAKEAEHLRAAITSGISAKLHVRDSFIRGEPGFGYTTISASLRRLDAYATLRTGRLLAVLGAASGDTFTVQPDEYGYMPGTSLQVLIPLPPRQRPAEQRLLPFDD